jgi:membrane fusion protein (multidrug efflux system)
MFRYFLAISLLLVAPALAQMGPAAVVTAPVEKRPAELTRPLVASVEPVTRTTVAAEQAGIVQERNFDEGQFVDKGHVLSRVKVDLLQLQRDATESERAALEGQLEQAKAELANAEREHARIKQLVERNVAPEKELNDAATRLRVAAAVVTTRDAQLAAKRAEVERLELMIEKASTPSPIGGVVARRHIEVGQWIEQGDAIADLVQLDPLHVRVNVPEDVIARVKVGDEAQITIDALGGQAFTGVIDQILPEADVATCAVKLKVDNPDLKIRPGFFARLVLSSVDSAKSFVVPRDAIVSRGPAQMVVVVRDGKAVFVPIQRLGGRGDKVWVAGDLKEDDQVVIRGNETLMPDAPVMVMNAPPPGAAQPATQAANQ